MFGGSSFDVGLLKRYFSTNNDLYPLSLLDSCKQVSLIMSKKKEYVRIRKHGDEIFTFLTFMYGSFDPDMLYIDMKVAFETVYIMLSRSHSLSRFQAFVLMYLQKLPTNEPLWKRRGESQSHFAGGQRGKFRRIKF